MMELRSKSSEVPKSATDGAVDRFLDHWRESLKRLDLNTLGRDELERMARELGLMAQDLEELAARGPAAADLVHQRMHALGLARSDAEWFDGLLHDMEKTCSLCDHAKVCLHDLKQRPRDRGWQDYCPNAITIACLKEIKGRSRI